MKNTMKRTLGFFAAALLTMTLALSAYASGHDLTFTDKGNRMHVKDKTVHVQTYYPYEYYVLDVLDDALVVANPEWDDCGFAVCRRITNEYLTIPAPMMTLFWTTQRNIWSMISSSCTAVSGPIPPGKWWMRAAPPTVLQPCGAISGTMRWMPICGL